MVTEYWFKRYANVFHLMRDVNPETDTYLAACDGGWFDGGASIEVITLDALLEKRKLLDPKYKVCSYCAATKTRP